jgi:transcriptional regulator with GAF, ATPase, and Fis domain
MQSFAESENVPECHPYRLLSAEDIMGYATIDFPDTEDFSNSLDVSANDDLQLDLDSQIRSESCFRDIIGQSSAIQKVLEEVEIVAPTNSTILLHGDTGTGK